MTVNCDTMGGVRFCVCECQSGNPFVCFNARPTQKGCARDRKWTREGMSQRRGSQQKGAEEISRLERAVKRRRRTRSTEISMVCGFCGSFARVHACVSSQNAQNVSRNSLSCAWSWLKSVFVRLFFSSTLSVVFYVSVKKCVMPRVGDERNH